MAVRIRNINVLNNVSDFFGSFQFEITFDAMQDLKDDLEWKLIYVGSAETQEHDQILETIYVGPISTGIRKFIFDSNSPNPQLIPKDDAIGVTVIILICSYKNQEFYRIGYYVNNEYIDEELRDNPPIEPEFKKVRRVILDSAPRITIFPINWEL